MFFYNINIFLIIRYLKMLNLSKIFILLKYNIFDKFKKKIKYWIIFQNLNFFLKKIKFFICRFELCYKLNLLKKKLIDYELNELKLQKTIFIAFEKLYNCKFYFPLKRGFKYTIFLLVHLAFFNLLMKFLNFLYMYIFFYKLIKKYNIHIYTFFYKNLNYVVNYFKFSIVYLKCKFKLKHKTIFNLNYFFNNNFLFILNYYIYIYIYIYFFFFFWFNLVNQFIIKKYNLWKNFYIVKNFIVVNYKFKNFLKIKKIDYWDKKQNKKIVFLSSIFSTSFNFCNFFLNFKKVKIINV